MDQQSRTCPECAAPMQGLFVSNVEVHRCGRCGGFWFDLGQLDAASGRAVVLEPLDGVTSRRCAYCRITLESALLPGAIPVETCAACRGIFLDAGELEEFSGHREPSRPRSAGPQGFVCVKCHGRFPFAEGNALASGLACRACTPKPQTTEAERQSANRRGRHDWGYPLTDSDDYDQNLGLFADFLDHFF
jgi:Zn-finger nucleic acid-binding protein